MSATPAGTGRPRAVAARVSGEVVDEFLDHERDPGGAGHRPPEELGADLSGGDAQLGRDEQAHLGVVEGPEVERGRGAALACPGGEFGGRAAGPPRDEQERGRLLPDVVEEVFEDRQGPGVGVVQIVEDEQAAAAFSDGAEQAQHRLADHDVRGGGGRVPVVAEQPGQDRAVVAQRVRAGEQAGAGQQEQRFDQGPVGDGRAHRAGPPLAVAMPAAAAAARASAARRVLPTPGSPVTKSAPPRPARAAVSAAVILPISAARPMSCAGPVRRPSCGPAAPRSSCGRAGHDSNTGTSPPRRAFRDAAGDDDRKGAGAV